MLVASSIHATTASSVQLRVQALMSQRVLAFGDSLTAGTHRMDDEQLFPYAPHLERVLCYGASMTAGASPPYKELFPFAPALEETLGDGAVVRHRGLPGWTAKAMLDYANDEQRGLCGILRRIRDPSVALAIILAGTNDVGCYASADETFEALTGLHGAAHALGVRTLAVGIPPSAFQGRDPVAAQTVADVNERLRAWCTAQRDALAEYVPHPVGVFEPGGKLWSSDGLHLSPEGYKATGERLAGVVRGRLVAAR